MEDRKYYSVLPGDIVRVSSSKVEGVSFSEHLTTLIKKDVNKGLGALANYCNGYIYYHFRVLQNDKLPSAIYIEQKGDDFYEYLTDIPVAIGNDKTDSDALFIRASAKVKAVSEIEMLKKLRLMEKDKLNLISKGFVEFNNIGRAVIINQNQKIKSLSKNSK